MLSVMHSFNRKWCPDIDGNICLSKFTKSFGTILWYGRVQKL